MENGEQTATLSPTGRIHDLECVSNPTCTAAAPQSVFYLHYLVALQDKAHPHLLVSTRNTGNSCEEHELHMASQNGSQTEERGATLWPI